MNLKRYWVKFDMKIEDPHPPGILIGCGITAYSCDDMWSLLRTKVFKNESIPTIKECVEDIDTSLLDRNHVLPNMSDPNKRGIWFPLGYD
jgi:hypothetical protein